MPKYDSYRVLKNACPQCGAEAKAQCLTNKGKPAAYLHTARIGLVYPSYMKGTNGGLKRGAKQTHARKTRAKLRNEVVERAMKYSGIDSPYPVDQTDLWNRHLIDACHELQTHRQKFPDVEG